MTRTAAPHIESLPATEAKGGAPVIVAMDMGYGHLRPAHALSQYLKSPLMHADQAPLADNYEQGRWLKARKFYEFISQSSQKPLIGSPFQWALEQLTNIPNLYPFRDLSRSSTAVTLLHRAAKKGLGQSLTDYVRAHNATLLTTFYAPAVLADFHGLERIICVVTDTDIHRIWAPFIPAQSNIIYAVPTTRTRRRLELYGVHRHNIHVTGFPLPHELLGGPDLPALKKNLLRRLRRLDPREEFLRSHGEDVRYFLGELPPPSDEPVTLTFAIGGAGAQKELLPVFLPSLAPLLERNHLQLNLVAGTRSDVFSYFSKTITDCKMEHLLRERIFIHHHNNFDSYCKNFNRLMADTDILWTKPSELVFLGALGIPMVLSQPVGVQEVHNRRYMRERGAGLKQRHARYAGEWISELLNDGTLAATAWNGFTHLPKFGLYQIAALLEQTARLTNK